MEQVSEAERKRQEYLARLHPLVETWQKKRDSLKQGQKESIGHAYLESIIGLSPEDERKFLTTDVLSARVGSGVGRNDYGAFWKKVQEVAPDVVPEAGLAWLVQEKRTAQVFIYAIDEMSKVPSKVLRKINVNTQIYGKRSDGQS